MNERRAILCPLTPLFWYAPTEKCQSQCWPPLYVPICPLICSAVVTSIDGRPSGDGFLSANEHAGRVFAEPTSKAALGRPEGGQVAVAKAKFNKLN